MCCDIHGLKWAGIKGRLTAKVSGPQNAGPLDRRVRPEGQKGAPSLEDVRSPRKTAGPRKRRSAARRIAGGDFRLGLWTDRKAAYRGLFVYSFVRRIGIRCCSFMVICLV